MHLKTLTLRGFKSFASATTLTFEPGVTCVVGPNGSGKSNVVDALAWVMGEQGAKSLRGGTMEDVIFAGTAGRAPLGRAEVALTIDNTDGALPIEYTEVTISRTLFRSGGSEYAINGAPCRLLDIQDLLSDTGMGREMHVIVGQGQLDAVLRATPEDRRGFIEEAAGVLKHRKRKEKALRKLEAMQANLTRLGDLTAEIRRQLGPLGRQAEVARRAQQVQSTLRDAKARLLADDLAQLMATIAQETADEEALRTARAEAEQAMAAARSRMAELERAAATAAPELAEISDTWYRLSALRDRVAGTATLAAERTRLLGAPDVMPTGQEPEDLAEQAARQRHAQQELRAEVAAAQQELSAAVAARAEAEAAAQDAERQLATLLRGVADRREGVARLAGQLAARRSRLEATEAEIGRLHEVLADAELRGAQASDQFAVLEIEAAGAERGEEGLDAEHEAATAALAAASERVAELRAMETAAEKDKASWSARIEALELSLLRKDGAGALLGGGEVTGLLGSLAGLVSIEAGYEDAVAAALGSWAGAVVVDSVEAAVDAIRLLRTEDAGRAELVVSAPADDDAAGTPAAGVPLLDLVHAAEPVRGALQTMLRRVVVVEDLAAARRALAQDRGLTVVTMDGDLLSGHLAAGGSRDAPSVLHLQGALEDATARYDAAVAQAERTGAELATALDEETAARRHHDATMERLNESDAALAAVAERLGQLGAAARGAAAEAQRLQASLSAAQEQLRADTEALEELSARMAAAEIEPAAAEEEIAAATGARDAAAAAASAARAKETEARLALRTAEERERAVAARAESLERAAAAAREARRKAAAAAEQRAAQAAAARTVQAACSVLLEHLALALHEAADARAAAQAAREELEAQLAATRAAVDDATTQLAQLTDTAHRDELARAQQQARVEALRERCMAELGTDPEVLVEEYGPHREVPAADGQTVPYVRAEQEKLLRKAERDLSLLGRVNPLALEEFAALEERHTFLVTQLADLKKSRADLQQIITEIDERVELVFTEAFADTAEQFEQVFARLFPGGEGRLVLTEPDDMLATGVEVEARPAGKKVKRLSLLSGGERSLTAIALLVAIFRARPSPFYVMDEVEAALDDVNLGRLLEIFTELRADSQLIVVTHQKRTMEIADVLYGVTMRDDGVTTVISQRLRDDAPS